MFASVSMCTCTICDIYPQGYGPDAVAVAANSLEAAAKKNAIEAITKAGYSVPSGAALSRAAAGRPSVHLAVFTPHACTLCDTYA